LTATNLMRAELYLVDKYTNLQTMKNSSFEIKAFS